MNNKTEINAITKNFSDKIFKRKDLISFFKDLYDDITESNINWKISRLKKEGIIFAVKRGKYKITSNKKIHYTHYLKDELINLSKLINDNYKEILFCIWESNWFNDFSRHQAARSSIIIEVEEDLVESVYYFLRDNDFDNVFFKPNEEIMEKYITEIYDTIIVKKLVSRAPIQNYKKVKIPKLEKMIVDIFCEEVFLSAYQGFEMKTIYENIFEEYEINYTTLLHYARRRTKEKEIKQFLIENIKETKEILL